jgi:hypothetical protein
MKLVHDLVIESNGVVLLINAGTIIESVDNVLDKFINNFDGISLNSLHGGVGDNIDDINVAVEKFGKEALIDGVKVELEHTDNFLIALEIAIDHLEEDKDYYIKLATIHHESNEYLSTCGIRSQPDKVWPEDDDIDDDDEFVKKICREQPINKEPDDWVKPRGSPKGPGD